VSGSRGDWAVQAEEETRELARVGYDDAMEPRRISCPLCRSDRVRLVASTDNLLVCACDACAAQFTVVKPTPDAPTEGEGQGS
jgi:transcription elongation factor Elf1